MAAGNYHPKHERMPSLDVYTSLPLMFEMITRVP